MSRTPISRKLTLLLVPVLFFVVNSVAGHGVTTQQAQPSHPIKAKCDSTSDDQISQEVVASIVKEFQADGPDGRKKNLRFTVFVKDKVIILSGFVKGADRYTKVIKAVKAIPSFDCVTALDIKRFDPFTKTGCAPNEKLCADGRCVDKNGSCTVF